MAESAHEKAASLLGSTVKLPMTIMRAIMLMRTCLLAGLTLVLAANFASAEAAATPGLGDVYATLAGKRFVDLTHAFGPDTPHWKGFGEMKKRTLYTIEKDGFQVDELCHVGQWGTHVDPPAHFHK